MPLQAGWGGWVGYCHPGLTWGHLDAGAGQHTGAQQDRRVAGYKGSASLPVCKGVCTSFCGLISMD